MTTAKKEPKLTIAKVAENLDKVVENTDNAMTELRETINEQGAVNKAILEMLKAKDTPVTVRKETDARSFDLGEGTNVDTVDSDIIQGTFDINSPQFQDKMKIERFMQEMVTIHIHESNNDLEVETFMVSVNNKKHFFRFGETKAVPRYIVETLARAKPETFNNVEKLDRHGNVFTENKGTRGLRYPFSVMQDTPVGRAWLQVVLRQK